MPPEPLAHDAAQDLVLLAMGGGRSPTDRDDRAVRPHLARAESHLIAKARARLAHRFPSAKHYRVYGWLYKRIIYPSPLYPKFFVPLVDGRPEGILSFLVDVLLTNRYRPPRMSTTIYRENVLLVMHSTAAYELVPNDRYDSYWLRRVFRGFRRNLLRRTYPASAGRQILRHYAKMFAARIHPKYLAFLYKGFAS